MKTNKVAASPLLSALIVLLLVTLAGMTYAIISDDRPLSGNYGLMLAVGGIVLVAIISMLLVRDARRRLAEQAEQNERNQAAILQLLDELADLAEGDLTVHASVTENFTGAIADSINFAIDQMRALVSNINRLSVRVARAADETQGTAKNLASAAENQAREISAASAAINDMAVSIDHVSSNAAESASVADRAVTIASKGSEVVHATISGMDNIRSQIQETAKRIKRLGESSQEIGDIVSLINDIADQTNILSLNAAIQASMAGDAGRGFAVVADEVQRLAERSSAATKQIAALVKTIQTDTNEAVISMEQTTAEVVNGAKRAQDAGVALEEIESVSNSLAELIQNISNAARQQAASAGHVSNTMNVIQEITSQTAESTEATARSIGALATMAKEMRTSVEGFKLPGDSAA
jgi:twitching motility protein PilJ